MDLCAVGWCPPSGDEMLGPSGKLYQPPGFRQRLLLRSGQDAPALEMDVQQVAEAMARVNDEKRQPLTKAHLTQV